MAVRRLRMMSYQGDQTLAEWDVDSVTADRLAEIETEFNAKVAAGYFAADITDKRDEQIREFNPNADILLVPRFVGGSRG